MDARVPISDVMSKSPETIVPEASIRDAARRMRDAGVGSLIVSVADRVVGIVTETDLVRKVLADGHPQGANVSDVMTKDPYTIEESGDIIAALNAMSRHDIRRLPVMREGRLVGMVTEKDIARVAPSLLEIVTDLAALNGLKEPGEPGVDGFCEECGNGEEDLQVVEGEALCSECRERLLEREQ